MNFDDSFPKRVSVARSAMGFTQSELAKRVGVVPRQIAAYEGGEARPREKALINLAAALGTTSEWLSQGRGPGPNVEEIKRTTTVREIPVLTNVMAGFTKAFEALDYSSATDYIPAPPRAGESSFALRISGHSMESASGVSFPDGCIVTFDPDIEPCDGHYVLCSIGDHETTFKKLAIEQGSPVLKPLNKEYSAIMGAGPHMHILAVAIHVQNFLNLNTELHPSQKWDPIADWRDQEDLNFNFELGLEGRVASIERNLEKVLHILTNKKPT